MTDPYDQAPAGVRFDWGPVAAERFAASCAGVVVVDVLSFTTAVDVAVGRGMRVYPWRWRDDSAVEFAARRGAGLAVGRSRRDEQHPWSLSPAVLRTSPVAAELVLPSPNGATLSVLAAGGGALVVCACLRNAEAVGRWLRQRGYGAAERPVGVVAAGERWAADGSLRPGVEDLLGAGAVVAAIVGAGPDRDRADPGSAGPCSVEAATARAVWWATGDPAAALRHCASGRELVRDGYSADVDVAAEVGASRVVPVLRDGAFVAVA